MHHSFQSVRMDDSGALQGCFSEVRPKFQAPNDILPKFEAFVGPPTVTRLTELKNFGTVGSAIGKSPRDKFFGPFGRSCSALLAKKPKSSKTGSPRDIKGVINLGITSRRC